MPLRKGKKSSDTVKTRLKGMKISRKVARKEKKRYWHQEKVDRKAR